MSQFVIVSTNRSSPFTNCLITNDLELRLQDTGCIDKETLRIR